MRGACAVFFLIAWAETKTELHEIEGLSSLLLDKKSRPLTERINHRNQFSASQVPSNAEWNLEQELSIVLNPILAKYGLTVQNLYVKSHGQEVPLNTLNASNFSDTIKSVRRLPIQTDSSANNRASKIALDTLADAEDVNYEIGTTTQLPLVSETTQIEFDSTVAVPKDELHQSSSVAASQLLAILQSLPQPSDILKLALFQSPAAQYYSFFNQDIKVDSGSSTSTSTTNPPVATTLVTSSIPMTSSAPMTAFESLFSSEAEELATPSAHLKPSPSEIVLHLIRDLQTFLAQLESFQINLLKNAPIDAPKFGLPAESELESSGNVSAETSPLLKAAENLDGAVARTRSAYAEYAYDDDDDVCSDLSGTWLGSAVSNLQRVRIAVDEQDRNAVIVFKDIRTRRLTRESAASLGEQLEEAIAQCVPGLQGSYSIELDHEDADELTLRVASATQRDLIEIVSVLTFSN